VRDRQTKPTVHRSRDRALSGFCIAGFNATAGFEPWFLAEKDRIVAAALEPMNRVSLPLTSRKAAKEEIMGDRRTVEAKLTRRRLLAGATVGTFALASDPAAAQRCPATPPVRAKGAAVWLDLDQQDLDDAYDQSVYAFNSRNIAERHAADNQRALSAIGKPERLAYGPADIEKLDVYRTKRPGAPTMVFIHGGAWRGGRSADFALYAEVFVKAGANFVAIDFNNVLETKGDFIPMVDQCRRAVAWAYRNAASFGGDARPAILRRHSRLPESRSSSSSARATITTRWARRWAIPTPSWAEPRSK
jgi:arylformamidase